MSSNAGRLTAILGLDSRGFRKGIKEGESRVARFGKKIAKIGAGLSVMSAGVAVAIKGQLNAADELSKSAQRLGVPIEELSALRHAADMSGVGVSDLDNSLRRLSRNMDDAGQGGKKTSALFARMGIDIKTAKGELRPTSEVMAEVAGVLSNMPDGAEKTALAFELFGRAGTSLIPMLNGGKQGLEGMLQEARDLGLVIDQKTGKAAENFNDNLSRLGKTLKGLVIQAMAALAPVLEDISGRVVELSTWFRDLSPTMKKITSGAVALAAVAGPVAVGLGAVLLAVAPLGVALAALASPIGLVVMAFGVIGAGAAYVASNWSDLVDRFPMLGVAARAVSRVAATAWEGLKAGVSTAIAISGDAVSGFKSLMEGDFKGALQSVKNIGSELANFFTKTFPGVTEIMGTLIAKTEDVGVKLVAKIKASVVAGFATASEWVNGLASSIESGIYGAASYFVRGGRFVVVAIKNGISAFLGDAVQAVKDLGPRIVQAISDMAASVLEAGKQLGADLLNGIKAGIDAKVEAVKSSIRGVVSQLFGVAEAEAEVKSPSRRFMRFGKFLMEGVAVGISKNAALAAEAAKQAAKGVSSSFEKASNSPALQKVKDAFGQVSDAISGAIVQGQDMGKALAGVFQQIASDLISSGIKGLLMETFGFGTTKGGGGFVSGLVNAFVGSIASFDGGGFTGRGSRTGGLDGKGGSLALVHPNETVFDHTKGQMLPGAAQSFTFAPVIDARGADAAAVERIDSNLRALSAGFEGRVRNAIHQGRMRNDSVFKGA